MLHLCDILQLVIDGLDDGLGYFKQKEQHLDWCCSFAVFMRIGPYDTSMALPTFFCSFSIFGRTTVRMPSSTLAEILSFSTSSGSV